MKQQLHSAQLDVETQIARADNAVLTKKKKKKLEKQAQELKNDAKAYAEENARLKERESALLEAVSSLQNLELHLM